MSVLDEAIARAAVTRAVAVESGAIAALPTMLRSVELAGSCQIVADANTMAAAGVRTAAVLGDAGLVQSDPIVLEGSPRLKPRAELSRSLAGRLKAAGATPIAVGSGVVNDIVKYAAEIAGLPYVSVATAASMDGYAASGGAMLEGGFKRTLACAPPIVVAADLDVIAKAPAAMGAWGYADLAGKVVAGADWILADALGEEAIEPQSYSLVQDNLPVWLADPRGVAAGDPYSLRRLTEGLLISGFAMQAYGNSRPASGGEHQISHVWEMEGLAVRGEPAAHGACVGVGAVAMLALYEWFLAQDPVGAKAGRATRGRLETEAVAAFADPALAEAARIEAAAKNDDDSARRRRLDTLGRDWSALRARIAAMLISPTDLEQRLVACHGAAHPSDLAVSLDALARDIRRARLIRRRYTLLDCLDDLGWLDQAIAALFSPIGFYGRRWRDERQAVRARQ